MGDERAEIYLGRLAEAEVRRVGDQLRRLDAAAEDPWADPGMPLFRIAEGASWKDVDGARFALAGLSTIAGETHLHVISSGMPQLAGRFQWNWTPGFSWWLRDSAGNWHVGSPGEPDTYGDGMSLYTFGDGLQGFWLRLTPPLTAPPGAAEIVVTGPSTRVRATVS